MKSKHSHKSLCRRRMLWLLAIAFMIGSVNSQINQRKIVSDDFTKSRREAINSEPASRSQVAGSRPKVRRTYRLASTSIRKQRSSSSDTITQLGITLWRLRRSEADYSGRRGLIREKGRDWEAERVESDAIFHEGDRIRISVESPRAGYLYVIDRELFADGTTGRAMLIYPWSNVDNQLLPGDLIDIPAQEDDPSYFAARLSSAKHVGELLTFIVSSSPLELPISNKPLQIANDRIREWEEMWGGESERFEMEGGAGEAWTLAEQRAATKRGARQLTRDDPAPQTIYRIVTRDSKAILVSLRLRYEN